jgi:subtilisin family serine protease
MRKNDLLLVLILIIVFALLGYKFAKEQGVVSEAPETSEASEVSEAETEAVETPTVSAEVVDEISGPKQVPAQMLPAIDSLQNRSASSPPVNTFARSIRQLIEGANLLGETTVEEEAGWKKVQVYDVGDRFKYPIVRVETTTNALGQESLNAMVADHLMIRMKESKGATPNMVVAQLKKMGLELRKKMASPGLYLVSVADSKLPVTSILEVVSERLGVVPDVVEPDYIVFAMGNPPNDPSYASLWGLHNTGGSGEEDADIDAPEAWDITTGSADVLVAVIDTGIDYNHEDLKDNIWTNPNEIAGDGIDNDNNGFIDDIHGWDFYSDDNDPIDSEGHGTHCAGTIGGVGNNTTGVVGVNWDVSLMAIQFLGHSGGSTSDGIDAINYATAMQVTLTSNSWGGGGYSALMKDAIAAAGAANQLFIAAAGNDSTNNDSSKKYPASYTFDAESDNIISVASTNRSDRLSYFSNYGATLVDIAAPGSDIVSTVPNNSYSSYSGTSMATPHVAGAMALYFSIVDGGFKKAKEDLLASVDKIPELDGRCVSNGRLNVSNLLMEGKVPFINLSSSVTSSEVGESNINSPGEAVSIQVEFANLGLEGTSGLVAELSASDPTIQFLVDTIQIGDLEAQSVIAPETAFKFFIPESFEEPKSITLTIDISDFNGKSWSHALTLNVNKEITITRSVQALVGDIPLEGVEVEYTNFYDKSISGVILSDANGVFSFQGINGYYHITLKKSGYLTSLEGLFEGENADRVPFVMRAPRIDYDTNHLVIEVLEGQKIDTYFSFSNTGDSYMEYQVGSGFGRIGLRAPVPVNVDHTIGYSFLWEDISKTGISVSLGDDTVSHRIQLGFNFYLYKKDYNRLKIGSNGLLLFEGEGNPYSNSSLHDESSPDEIVAFFWDDLDFDDPGSSAFYEKRPGKIIFQFEDVVMYGYNDKKFSAQVILSDDNSIQVMYKKVDVPSASTIGIRAVGVGQVHEIACNNTVLTSGSNLFIQQNNGNFGTVNESGFGILKKGETKRVPISIDARNLRPGVYRDSFEIEGSWAYYDGPEEVMIEVQVLPAPNYKISSITHNEASLPIDGATNVDGDGYVEAGETAELELLLVNTGSVNSSPLLAEIVSDSPYCTVIQQDSSFDPITVINGKTCKQPFVVKYDASSPVNTAFQMYLRVLDDDMISRTIPFELSVGLNEQLVGKVTEINTGTPLQGVVVECGESIATTDASGNYTLQFNDRGSFTLTVSKENYITAQKSVDIPADEELNFVLSNPKIESSTEALELILYQGEVLNGEIKLFNRGCGSLEWRIASSPEWNYFTGYELNTDVHYEWDDIVSRGRNIQLLGDDVVAGPFRLERNFKFYENDYDSFYISTNGFISFDHDLDARYQTSPLESNATGFNKLAFFWSDLIFDSNDASCYIHTEDDGTFVIQFNQVRLYREANKVTVQTRLKPDGQISLIYKMIENPNSVHLRGLEVGLKGKNSSEVFSLKPYTSTMSSESTFVIKPNNFKFGQLEGAMEGEINKESARLRYSIDTTSLKVGNYQDTIKISSNDTHGNETLEIPVRLLVYQNDIYDVFMKDHKVSIGERGIHQDLDNDGFNNLEEFAFGLDPLAQEFQSPINIVDVNYDDPALSSSQASNYMELIYRRRTDDCGFQYKLESSQDLKNWSPAKIDSETTSPTLIDSIEEVLVRIPQDPDNSNCYYRVKVSPDAP